MIEDQILIRTVSGQPETARVRIRQVAREKYVRLCRAANSSGKREDAEHAQAFLDGCTAMAPDGDLMFDFCCAADEAALEDGYPESCWGLNVEPSAEKKARQL